MITYDATRFNCSHYAVQELNKAHGLSIDVSGGIEWQPRFLRILRMFFAPINAPCDNCLVVMRNHDNTLHIGIYRDYGVWHNWERGDGSGGCLIKSDLSTIRANYLDVHFYGRNKTLPAQQSD